MEVHNAISRAIGIHSADLVFIVLAHFHTHITGVGNNIRK